MTSPQDTVDSIDSIGPDRSAPTRREFVTRVAAAAAGLVPAAACGGARSSARSDPETEPAGAVDPVSTGDELRLFLCGDVMTGRGVDQILAHPSDPELHEAYVRSAAQYVALAEQESGTIPRRAGPTYVWGDLLRDLAERAPDLRIANLETSVTTSDDAAPGKGIHYRMHPENVGVLEAAGLDACVLANNHVLDYGVPGLIETLEVLDRSGIAAVGAGRDRSAAVSGIELPVSGDARVRVLGFGGPDCGIPPEWDATAVRPGVNRLDDDWERAARRATELLTAARRAGDLVVASIHWGSNWGYDVPREHRELARRLVESEAADVIHGHSSHHRRAIEVRDGKLVLYGCGDFLNDYEGIGGRDEFRPELVLGYLASLERSTGRLTRLEMLPYRIRRFRLERADPSETEWLRDVMAREGEEMGTGTELTGEGTIELKW